MEQSRRKETESAERVLKRILVKKFQSHTRTSIKLHPRVNVIVGDSMKGKTAILRGILLALDNSPSGAQYYSNHCDVPGTTVVKLVFHDTSVELQKRVNRTKDGKKKVLWQKYIIDGDDELEGFKSKVPKEVQEALDINKITFQTQLEQPFILAASGPQIARIINDITGLENVDEWQRTINTMVLRESGSIKDLQKAVKEEKTVLSKYKGLDDVGKLIKDYERLTESAADLEDRIEVLSEAVSELQTVDRRISILTQAKQELEELRKQQPSAKENQYEAVMEAALEYISAVKNIKAYKLKLGGLKKRYVETLRRLKRCPFCASKVKDVNHIIEHII